MQLHEVDGGAKEKEEEDAFILIGHTLQSVGWKGRFHSDCKSLTVLEFQANCELVNIQTERFTTTPSIVVFQQLLALITDKYLVLCYY